MEIIVTIAVIGLLAIIILVARSKSRARKAVESEIAKQLLIRASQEHYWGGNNPEYKLGVEFEGRGEYVKAGECYRKAAEQGCALAQYEIGVMSIEGRGVSQNYPVAAGWFRKAAEQGIPQAQANLGLHYARGIGVEKDSAEAVKWFRKAADQGFADGQFKLGAMYANGEGVPQDFKEALRLINLAADQGHAEAKVERELVARKAFFAGAL